MEKITGTIITLNEEKNIESCIVSLWKVCDEIVVVDSQSTDKTVEIARQHNALVFEQEYLGDGPQKAVCAEYASNDWILSIDADERLEDDMVDALQKIDYTDPTIAYAFRRKNFAGSHWIKAAGFYPDYVIRLYNRTISGYSDRKAHSRVKAPKEKKISAHITHYTYESYSHWIQRLDWMTSRDAWAYYGQGRKPSNMRPVLSSAGAFFQKFILKGGIFQGIDGWTVTLTSVMRAYMKYLKLNELHRNKKKE